MNFNKRILITGATGNIGTALCHHLITKNYDLIITSRSEEKLHSLSDRLNKIKNKSGEVTFSQSDFSDPNSFEKLTHVCSQQLDGIVLLPPPIKPGTNCLPPDDHWEILFKNCFIGPLALIRALLPILKKRKPV